MAFPQHNPLIKKKVINVRNCRLTFSGFIVSIINRKIMNSLQGNVFNGLESFNSLLLTMAMHEVP